jgi:hypothetical protein
MVLVAVVVVVDAGDSAASLNGVLGVAVGPDLTLDHRSPGSSSVLVALMPRGGGVRAVCRRRSPPVMCRPLARHEALHLWAAAASRRALSCYRTLLSSEVAASRQLHNSIAATAKLSDAHIKSGGASPSTSPSLAHQLSSRACP